MPTDSSTVGPGERLVEMLACAQRETDRVEGVLPSVDHLALRRRCPDVGSVEFEVRRLGPQAVLEPFESWWELIADFDRAVRRLTELRDAPGDGSDYQKELDMAVDDARICRHAAEEANANLQRRVAALIDAALARGP